MSNQNPIKAEVTVRILSDGGFVIQGSTIEMNPMTQQPEGVTDQMRARVVSSDIMEDLKNYLAKHSDLAVVS